jgi:hypothetical protein
MRSDKIRDISMNFDSIAATSLDVSYGASVTSASDPLSAENRAPASRSIVTDGMRTRRAVGFAV